MEIEDESGRKREANDEEEVSMNGRLKILIKPDTDFSIDTITIDGVPLPLTSEAYQTNSYTFENVTSDHTFAVNFREQLACEDGGYFLTWTKSVSYDGRSHIQKGGKVSKKKVAAKIIKMLLPTRLISRSRRGGYLRRMRSSSPQRNSDSS